MGRAVVLNQHARYHAGVSAYMDVLYAERRSLTKADLRELRARADYIEGRIDIEAFERRIGYGGTFRCGPN